MAVRDLVDAAFQRARALLLRNRELLTTAAKDLLEKESLADGQLQELLAKVRPEERLAA
jgi:cell division protease FtsH